MAEEVSVAERGRALRGLALNPPRRVPLRQRIDLGDGRAIEIARNRLLQRARGHRKAQRGVGSAARDERVNQAGGEAVAAADAIDEADVVALAFMERRRGGVPRPVDWPAACSRR